MKIIKCIITYSMQQSPSWEATRFVAIQEIPRILLNPNVHYRIHNFPPPVSILSQPNPVHTPTSHILKIHPNIILPSMPRSPHWSVSLGFTHQNCIQASLLPYPRYMPRPSHSSRFYHPHSIGWAVQMHNLFGKIYVRILFHFNGIMVFILTIYKQKRNLKNTLFVTETEFNMFPCNTLINLLNPTGYYAYHQV
jgi:hypothetical protein